jgi:hypothetical protein
MTEIKELRRYLRMPNSINNHSERCYEYDGAFYMIDKETDTIPRSYRLYGIYGDPRIKVQGLELIQGDFGDNLSWNKAIVKAKVIIDNWIDSLS